MPLTASSAYCQRCKTTFPIPNRLPRNVLNRLASTHARSKIDFIKEARGATSMSLPNAKALAFHIVHDATCHWCGDPIPVTAIATCSCRATSIDLSLAE